LLADVKLTKNYPVAMLGYDKGAVGERRSRINDYHAALGKFGRHTVAKNPKGERFR
jgi:hypothetical protein